MFDLKKSLLCIVCVVDFYYELQDLHQILFGTLQSHVANDTFQRWERWINPCALQVPTFAGWVREPTLLWVRGGCESNFYGEGAGCIWCGYSVGVGWEILWVLRQSKWT